MRPFPSLAPLARRAYRLLALILSVLPLLALAPPLATWQVALAAGLGGAGLIFLNSVWSATMQQLIPDQVRSRVDSYDWLISLVVMPAGYALAGPLAAAVGDAATLTGAAFVLGIPCALVVLLPGIRAVRRDRDGKITGPPVRTASAVAEAASD